MGEVGYQIHFEFGVSYPLHLGSRKKKVMHNRKATPHYLIGHIEISCYLCIESKEERGRWCFLDRTDVHQDIKSDYKWGPVALFTTPARRMEWSRLWEHQGVYINQERFYFVCNLLYFISVIINEEHVFNLSPVHDCCAEKSFYELGKRVA